MEESCNQFDFWKNTSECIKCIYAANLTNDWSMFTDKVALSTHSDKVLLCLEDSKKSEFLFYSYKNSPNSSLPLQSTKVSQRKDVIGLNGCIQLFSDVSLPSSTLPSHCYFCKNNIFHDENMYQMIFAVSKNEQHHKYNNKELITLLYLLPHLLISLKSSLSYTSELNVFKSLQQTTNLASKGVILYDQQGKIIFVNQFMINQLVSSDFMKIENNDLVLNKQYENIRFHQLLQQMIQQPLSDIKTLTLDNENGSHALISIIPLSQQIYFSDDIAKILITVSFEQLMNWSLISHEYQLTSKELILLKALHKNNKMNELPQTLGVTINTLRTHLQSVFHKVHVNSQTELMIRLGMFKI
mgnify:CR=1 FL=1